jgi:myo-inositol-hexaphosphate 3-phosphohydrolase
MVHLSVSLVVSNLRQTNTRCSPITGKYYPFVNAKDIQYFQYELSSTLNGTFTTTLIRSFRGGSGQVEGCVVDDENSWIFIGEESYGLWRYSAEPPVGLQPGAEDDSVTVTLVDTVDG